MVEVLIAEPGELSAAQLAAAEELVRSAFGSAFRSHDWLHAIDASSVDRKEPVVAIVLDHTIVPAADGQSAATFFAELMGLSVSYRSGPFFPVSVNESLTLDFDDRGKVHAGHFGFLVDEDTFQAVLNRLSK
jgi:hypothetical protein